MIQSRYKRKLKIKQKYKERVKKEHNLIIHTKISLSSNTYSQYLSKLISDFSLYMFVARNRDK